MTRDEGEARDPAGEPPQQIVGGDQRNQEAQRDPDACAGRPDARQRVDQIFDAVLRADRTSDRRQHRRQDDGMGRWAHAGHSER